MGIETIRIALRNIRANKMRSALTMLGIIIGVAAVILLSAVGRAATDNVTSSIQSLGTNLLQVMPGAARSGGVSRGAGSASSLTMADVQAIQIQDAAVGAVAPLLNGSGQVVWHASNYSTSIQGTTANYSQAKSTPLGYGRSFTPEEVSRSAAVAVLGSTVVQNLFPAGMNPVGQTIDINQIPFKVIGVLKTEGTAGFVNQDDRIIIPITADMNLLDGTSYLTGIYVSVKSAALMNFAQVEITNTLRAVNQLTVGQANNFQILNQATILSTLTSITGTLTKLLAGIAGISLIVGGIGIMNIMLVSVTERTREIGIRKAIGATRGAILSQFVVEATFLSMMGGIIGVLVGVAGAMIGESVTHYPHLLATGSMFVAFFFALMVGVVFGVYPARKAANLKPIDALRFE